jgi:branched-chain amino acid transport system ATP-binding protein
MKALVVDTLNVRIQAAHIIQGISLTVPQGQTLALIGHNGVGKTTLVRAIMGLTGGIFGGSIVFDGRDITKLPAWERPNTGLCYVPQSRRIFPSLTVEEHLLVAARPGRPGTRAWSCQDMYDLFPNLASRRKQRGGLSGGEQQMLAIARALMGNPKMVIMDEPTEGLSPAMVGRVQSTLNQIKGEGIGVLVVEQNIKFAAAVADKVCVQNAGRIVFQGIGLSEFDISKALSASSGFKSGD